MAAQTPPMVPPWVHRRTERLLKLAPLRNSIAAPAAIRHGPQGQTRLGGYDTHQTKVVQGLVKLVNGDNWLAAVASDWWSAERALSLIAPRFAAEQRAESAEIDKAIQSGTRSIVISHLNERICEVSALETLQTLGQPNSPSN